MTKILEHKIVFITGATSGFGLALLKRCVAEGAKVIALGRRADKLAALQKEYGNAVYTAICDVREREKVESLVAALPKEFASVDVLINNAGLALGMGKAPDTNMDDWEQMVDTNIKGVLYITHALLPGMVARNNGHIINLGSIAGSYPYAGGNVYGATKAFLMQFSLNLRSDLLGKQIRVSNIEPGMAETEFSLVRFNGDAQKAHEIYAGMQPLTAEDIADAILFCLTAPQHVNINRLEIMPTAQAFNGFSVHRKESV